MNPFTLHSAYHFIVARHLGEFQMHDTLWHKYDWSDRLTYVYDIDQHCEDSPQICTKHKDQRCLLLSRPSSPIEIILIEVLGLSSQTGSGIHFIFIITGRCSKRTLAKPTLKATFNHVAYIFPRNWSKSYGVWDSILFENKQQVFSYRFPIL